MTKAFHGSAKDIDKYIEYTTNLLDARRVLKDNPNAHIWGRRANDLAELLGLPEPYDSHEWRDYWFFNFAFGGTDVEVEGKLQACIRAAEALRKKVTPAREKKRNRPTVSDMANRNRSVASFIMEFERHHDRAPTVHEVQDATGLTCQQIYATSAYKENRILKRGAVTPSQVTGKSTAPSEYFGGKSEEASRTNRRTKFEQDEIDALIDDQRQDDESNFVS